MTIQNQIDAGKEEIIIACVDITEEVEKLMKDNNYKYIKSSHEKATKYLFKLDESEVIKKNWIENFNQERVEC